MSNPRYPEEFKIEAVRQVTERGEPAEFGKNRTLTVQASRPRPTVAC
jgi:transposase-like protein